MKSTLIIVLLCLLLSGCLIRNGVTQPDFPDKQSKVGLRNDGVYSLLDTSTDNCGNKRSLRFEFINTVVFLPNNYFLNTNMNLINSEEVVWRFSKFYQQENVLSQGKYFTQNDSVYLNGYFEFWGDGKCRIYRWAHYRGYIKNKDTIEDWRIIPPYPKINMRLNDYLVEQKTPMTMVFKQLDLSKTLDENKLWIIEEQKKRNISRSTN